LFRGSFQHLIDQKGRVSIPAPFRELIQLSGRSDLWLTHCPLSPPRAIEAYPVNAWQILEEKIMKLNRFDPTVFKLENFLLGSAHRCEIDGQGRILVPPALRQWAELTKEVMFVGASDKFRIWDLKAWEQSLVDAEAAFKTDPAALSRLNL
jgi:MraZ protein